MQTLERSVITIVTIIHAPSKKDEVNTSTLLKGLAWGRPPQVSKVSISFPFIYAFVLLIKDNKKMHNKSKPNKFLLYIY
jgi:hypothetical protein